MKRLQKLPVPSNSLVRRMANSIHANKSVSKWSRVLGEKLGVGVAALASGLRSIHKAITGQK